MRLYVQVNGERHRFAGNMATVFEQLLDVAGEQRSVRVLTMFYDSTKEKRRFKREWRAAGKDLLQTARNYLAWWRTVQARRQRPSAS
ncbi:hypothetical protein HRbin17_01049 [bacterium HR17]|uniref:Uncharacterized protein n=1 Tax=Candidatus Fervidibacter japonicus TaxID=2035412 RepID=A0A2H5XBH1_9BACT|nr:hypothetical protein HRbin17_01049 [bacterium HR17]